MKRTLKYANMRHKFFVFCSALAVVLLAMATLTQGQKTGTAPVVPLRVTVEPMDSSSAACKICGDGLGEYVDGIDGVSASFTKYGWLSISFQEGASLRSVNFDYSTTGNPSLPPVLPVYSPKVTSGVDPDTILQNMSNGTTHCIRLGWSYTDGSNITRNHGFQFGPHVNGSSYAIISCTAQNVDGQCVSWTAEPKVDGTCNTSASVAGINDRIVVRGKATDYDRGRFTMPFKLTLVRK